MKYIAREATVVLEIISFICSNEVCNIYPAGLIIKMNIMADMSLGKALYPMLRLLQNREVREILHTIHTYHIKHAPKYIGEYFPDLMGNMGRSTVPLYRQREISFLWSHYPKKMREVHPPAV